MIKYALRCGDGHEFESWFPSSDSFEKQKKRGLLTCGCDGCTSTKFEKAIMAPAISKNAEPAPAPRISKKENEEMLQKMREMQEQVEANTEDVGRHFAREAVAIDAGKKPDRGIRGSMTMSEHKKLRRKGVVHYPYPVVRREPN